MSTLHHTDHTPSQGAGVQPFINRVDAPINKVEAKPYIIVAEGDTNVVTSDSSVAIRVPSIEEAVETSTLLGNACEVVVSNQYYRRYPTFAQELRLLQREQLYIDMPSCNRASVIMKKIPLALPNLVSSHLELLDGQTTPTKIERQFVHKSSEDNVLLSTPYQEGNFWYFNLLSNTEEIRFDHASDHIEGLLLLEALRQSSVATGHLIGLPIGAKIALQSFDTEFFRFINSDSPVLIRSYGYFPGKPDEQDQYCSAVCQVFQWGKLCVQAITKGYALINSDHYSLTRRRTEKIALLQKKQYQRKVSRLSVLRGAA